MQRLLSDQDVELAVMEGIADVVEDEAVKLVTSRTLGSAHAMSLEELRDNYYATSGYSRGVLVNARGGGLKRVWCPKSSVGPDAFGVIWQANLKRVQP